MIERDESRLIAQEDKNREARVRSFGAHDVRPSRKPRRDAPRRDVHPK